MITDGSVTFERTTRPADFESKKASVTLTFTVEPGEDASLVAAEVGLIAQTLGLAMVGLPKVEAPKRTRRAAAASAEALEQARQDPPQPDPVAIAEPEAAAPIEAAPVTDKDLADACGATRQRLAAKGYDAIADIRKLVSEYAAPSHRSVDIPQEKRAAFLDALKSLTNA